MLEKGAGSSESARQAGEAGGAQGHWDEWEGWERWEECHAPALGRRSLGKELAFERCGGQRRKDDRVVCGREWDGFDALRGIPVIHHVRLPSVEGIAQGFGIHDTDGASETRKSQSTVNRLGLGIYGEDYDGFLAFGGAGEDIRAVGG